MIAREHIKKLKITLAIALTGSCLIMASCDFFCSSGDEYDFAYYNRLGFTIVDRLSMENVLKIGQVKYNYDTLKVCTENWSVVFPEGNGDWEAWDGWVDLVFIDRVKDEGVLNRKIAKRFYFCFDYGDVDTIDIEFEMRRNDCDEQVVKYFKVTYDDSLYFDKETDFVPSNLQFLK